jgi:hypothetical protein
VQQRVAYEEAWIQALIGPKLQELRFSNALGSGLIYEDIQPSKQTNHGSRVKFSHEKLKNTNQI